MKRPVRFKGIWRSTVLLLGAALCAASFLYGPKLWTIVKFAGNAHIPSLDSDFSRLGKILPDPDTPIASLHLGLAHNFNDKDQFIQEVLHERTISYRGYWMHEEEWRPPADFIPIASHILTNATSFGPYRGPKLCGGYHMDFSAAFLTPTGECRMLVCLGCGEVLLFRDGNELICELSTDAEHELLSAYASARGFKHSQPPPPARPAGR